MTYLERLKQSNEEINQAQAVAHVRETENELTAKIANKNAQITRLENRRDGMLNKYPLNWEGVIELNEQIREEKESVRALAELGEDLFGE